MFLREGDRGGEGGPLSLISISIIIGEHMKTLCFKFHPKSVSFRVLVLGGKILSGGPKGGRVARFKKNLKILVQNGGLNPQPKFQHSS